MRLSIDDAKPTVVVPIVLVEEGDFRLSWSAEVSKPLWIAQIKPAHGG